VLFFLLQWARIGGLKAKELYHLEVEFLCKIGFSLMVSRSEYEWYCEELRDRSATEQSMRSCASLSRCEVNSTTLESPQYHKFLPVMPCQPLKTEEEKAAESKGTIDRRARCSAPGLEGQFPKDGGLFRPEELGQRIDMGSNIFSDVGLPSPVSSIESVCHGPASELMTGPQIEGQVTGPMSAGSRGSWDSIGDVLHSDGPLSVRRSQRSSGVSSSRGMCYCMTTWEKIRCQRNEHPWFVNVQEPAIRSNLI